jgi:hypothetical protein
MIKRDLKKLLHIEEARNDTVIFQVLMAAPLKCCQQLDEDDDSLLAYGIV